MEFGFGDIGKGLALMNPITALPTLFGGGSEGLSGLKDTVLGGRGTPGILGLGSVPVAPSEYAPAQNALIAQLQSRVRGGQPSQAEMMLRNAQGDAASNARSQVLSQRGLTPAIAARLSSRAGEKSGMQLASQASMLKAQEQLQAEQLLASLLSQTRNQEFQREMLITSNEKDRMLARQGLIQGLIQGGMSMGGGGASGGGLGGAGGIGGSSNGAGGMASMLSGGI